MDIEQCNIEIAKFKHLEGKTFRSNTLGYLVKVDKVVCYKGNDAEKFIIMINFTDSNNLPGAEKLDYFLENYYFCP